MEHDCIETMGASLVQHGRSSDRVYLMKLDTADMPGIVGRIDQLARDRGYTKAFVKTPACVEGQFTENGYRREAFIPGFYAGREDGVFLCKYFDQARARARDQKELDETLAIAQSRAGEEDRRWRSTEGVRVIRCGPEDVDRMSRLYREVFDSYPFPITDPGYLRVTMESHIEYFGVAEGGRFVALSSAEMDREGMNAEMTDFATLGQFRGRGLAGTLLAAMEEAMIDSGILVAYTIARAVSVGVNVIFARGGYRYGGTLVNNTQISGAIESMNVWWKRLQ